MDISIFTSADLEEISAHGMTPEKVFDQIEKFKKGMPFTKIVKPCTVNDGIRVLDDNDIEKYIRIFTDAQSSGRCMKFVPASGAASRMFRLLLEMYNDLVNEGNSGDISGNDETGEKLSAFINSIGKYAFYNDLKQAMVEDSLSLEECIKNRQIKIILEYLLFEKGLNLSNIPKGMIPFHRYSDHSRTPFEEHLVEAFSYTKDKNGKIRIHFTVSPEQENKVREFIRDNLGIYEKEDAVYEIGYSCQKPSTDTIAVDLDDNPFREDNGSLLFRPGGHGALIENLSELEGDIIFIKNIDNVVTDKLRDSTYKYKKALGGLLISLQKEIFGYIKTLMGSRGEDGFYEMLFSFINKQLSIIPPADVLKSSNKEKKEYLLKILNRPLRICGMVKNMGEPGGGPFWVKTPGKGISIQIVETSQIDQDKADQKQLLESATHFNPVDLVCAVRDYNGFPFNLKKYVDNDAGFISSKSKKGRGLKAMELPGLWNGSMAYWNTVFVEVPAGTFSPVKTVFDLMDTEHQSQK